MNHNDIAEETIANAKRILDNGFGYANMNAICAAYEQKKKQIDELANEIRILRRAINAMADLPEEYLEV